jgi:hypothetical protein
MDRHFISDSLLFDAWCWREATPAILKRAIQQLATIGVNYTTIEADCWYGERTPAQNYELQCTPFKPLSNGEWDLAAPNLAWDVRLKEFVQLCNASGIIVQLQLFTQQYSHWSDFMPWSRNINGVNGLWPCTDYHRAYVHRAVEACLGLNVRFSAGCELMGNPDEVAQFHVDVLETPYLRQLISMPEPNPLTLLLLGTDQGDTFVVPSNSSLPSEQIKGKFDKLWVEKYGAEGKDSTAYFIRRYAHGVHRLNVSGALDIGIRYHAPYATQWEYSTDGDWSGDSPVDFIEHQGRIDRKPSWAQMFALSGKLFDAFNRPIVIDVFHEGQYDGATGRPVMERLIDLTPLLANTLGVVMAYEERHGLLANHGRPVDPYIPPECKIGEFKKETCWDGSEIITHVCTDGRWVATGNACPVKPPDKPKITWQGWLALGLIAVTSIVAAVIIF